MQSPEFPELKFVKPKSWHTGRDRPGQPTLIVIHDTEGSEGRSSAEDGAAYDQRRTDGTSTHFFVDADSVVQCVLTKDTANHAKAEGNIRGIGFELCGRASQTQAQWLDGGLDLRLAATYVARCCKKWGIPVRRLSVAQMRAGQKGICSHGDVTAAWHQSDHTDPGDNFPWSEFLAMVEGGDMSEVWDETFQSPYDGRQLSAQVFLRYANYRAYKNGEDLDELKTAAKAILAAVTAGGDTDAIIAGVRAELAASEQRLMSALQQQVGPQILAGLREELDGVEDARLVAAVEAGLRRAAAAYAGTQS